MPKGGAASKHIILARYFFQATCRQGTRLWVLTGTAGRLGDSDFMSCHFSVQCKVRIICTGGSYYTLSDKSWQGISPEFPYSKETEGG